jgi:hypothetical protein
MIALDAGDAAQVKARMFIAVAKADHTVTPAPALDFAKKIGVEPFIMINDCGHSSHLCPDAGLGKAIREFLGK